MGVNDRSSLWRTSRVAARALGAASVTGVEFGALWAQERLQGADPARRDAYVRDWSRRLLAVLGVSVIDDPSLASLPPAPPNGRLLVANHRSMLDILVVLSRFGGNMLSKDDLQRWPVVARLAAVAGTLYVDRGNSASGAASIRRVRERLSAGRTVTVFPEGTTFPGDEVRPFHAGAFLAAVQAGAEVLPVGLAYREPEAIYFQESMGAFGQRLLAQPSIRVAFSLGEILASKGTTSKRLTAAAETAVQAAVVRARATL